MQRIESLTQCTESLNQPNDSLNQCADSLTQRDESLTQCVESLTRCAGSLIQYIESLNHRSVLSIKRIESLTRHDTFTSIAIPAKAGIHCRPIDSRESGNDIGPHSKHDSEPNVASMVTGLFCQSS